MSVYKAINAVQAELAQTGITKDRRNQQQRLGRELAALDGKRHEYYVDGQYHRRIAYDRADHRMPEVCSGAGAQGVFGRTDRVQRPRFLPHG